jgi:hypothetical protein
MPHKLWGQGGWDWKKVNAMAQHKAVVGPNEATCQGRCRHAIAACDRVDFHLGDGCTAWRGAVQICNKWKSLGHTSRAQWPHKDKTRPRRGTHAHLVGLQVENMVIIQGSQGGRQARLLARNRALHQWHLHLPTLLYLGAWGPERPMHGIMEHAQGWCKQTGNGGANIRDVSRCWPCLINRNLALPRLTFATCWRLGVTCNSMHYAAGKNKSDKT